MIEATEVAIVESVWLHAFAFSEKDPVFSKFITHNPDFSRLRRPTSGVRAVDARCLAFSSHEQ